MTKTLRLAIVGAGWAGERQIQAIREWNGAVMVAALVDNDADFLRAKAAELEIDTICTDYDAVLRDPNVDAVSICTPHALHYPMSIAAAEAGKHILVEKPIALTVDDATRMIDAADANGVKLYVAENLAYQPLALFLRQVVSSGEFIGELTAAALVWGFRAANFSYPGRRAWLTQPQQGGTGTWMLHGIHTMAQLRYIFGEVSTVYLREHHASSFQRPDIEGTMTGVLSLERGIHITVLQTCETRTRNHYTLYGDAGVLRADADAYEIHTPEGVQRLAYPDPGLSEYALEIKAFAEYVLDGADRPTTGRSERRSLAIVQAGYESAASGQPVILRERFGAI
ncbi:MAG: Gfo/Idh/MocA family oxidoreductase [Anaerolineae bacterium]|nr:Gfo/Idh/MocA family oxidoreductase [Anaerolineae bacterium]